MVALHGWARDYRMCSDDVLRDILTLIRHQSDFLTACMSSLMQRFVAKSMFYVIRKFVKLNMDTVLLLPVVMLLFRLSQASAWLI